MKQIWFKCECGSKRFRIRMFNDWDKKDIDPETGANETQCEGAVECARCGKNFIEMGV